MSTFAPRAPWAHIGRPQTQQRPPDLPKGAASLEEAARAIGAELAVKPQSVRRALEKAVRAGKVPRAAGGGRHGRSVWVMLTAARAWATAHYGGIMAKAKEVVSDRMDALDQSTARLLEELDSLPVEARATIGGDLVATGRRGLVALLQGIRRARAASVRGAS